MSHHLNIDVFLKDDDDHSPHMTTTGTHAVVEVGAVTIYGTGAQLFAFATAVLDAVNLCPPFPEPEYLTGGPAPTRDGDDLADWIDPIVKGAVAP